MTSLKINACTYKTKLSLWHHKASIPTNIIPIFNHFVHDIISIFTLNLSSCRIFTFVSWKIRLMRQIKTILLVNILYYRINILLLMSVSFHSVQIKHVLALLQDTNTFKVAQISTVYDCVWDPQFRALFLHKLLWEIACPSMSQDCARHPIMTDALQGPSSIATFIKYRPIKDELKCSGLDLLIHFYGATPGQHLLCRVANCSFQKEFDK